MKKLICLFYFFFFLGFFAWGQCTTSAFTGILDGAQIEFIKCIDDHEKAVKDAYDFVDQDNVGEDDYQNPMDGSFFIDIGSNNNPIIVPINYDDLYKDDCDGTGNPGGWQPLTHLKNLAVMANGYAIASNSDSPFYDSDKAAAIAHGIVIGLDYWYGIDRVYQDDNMPIDRPFCTCENTECKNINPEPCPEPCDSDCDIDCIDNCCDDCSFSACPPKENCSPSAPCNPPCPDDEKIRVPRMPWCCDSFFANHIEQQRELQGIAIFFYDFLNDADNIADYTLPANGSIDLCQILDDIINHLPDDITNNSGGEYTGANLADAISGMIARGILSGDVELITEARGYLEDALEPNAEGIQSDFSFHQHGPILYTNGYGQSLIERLSIWGAILSYPDQTVNNICYPFNSRQSFYNFILDGYRWTLRGATSDYSAAGRYIARPYPGSNAAVPSKYIEWVKTMATNEGDCNLSSTLCPDLSDLIVNSVREGKQAITGNKYYWKSDYVSHHHDKYVSTVHMVSPRTLGTESIDVENLKGYWLPYGCTFFYMDGEEYIRPYGSGDYESIFPFWDWNFVPGVTNVILSDTDLEPGDNDRGREANTQENSFVGHAGNGDFGVTVMNLHKNYPENNDNDELMAKKSWFHLGDEVVALGAGISADHSTHTTVNQCLSEGQYSSGTGYVSHGGIAYIFPDAPPETPTNGPQMQNALWSDINSCEDNNVPPNECEPVGDGDVFKLWIDHGSPTPSSPASYYYIVAPGQGHEPYLASPTNPNPLIQRLVNTVDVQAVKRVDSNNKTLRAGIIYYNDSQPIPVLVADTDNVPGTIVDNISLNANRPCALFFDNEAAQICVSSPDRGIEKITVTVNIGGNNSDMIFDLPKGNKAGSSKCLKFSDFSLSQSCGDQQPTLTLDAVFNMTGYTHDWTVKDTGTGTYSTSTGDIANSSNTSFTLPASWPLNESYTIEHCISLNSVEISCSEEEIFIHETDHPGDLVLNGIYQTWDVGDAEGPVRVISGDLVLENGAGLDIRPGVTVMFCGTNSKLIVNSGCVLTLSGTLTGFGEETWQGVRVGGNPNKPHSPFAWFSVHGRLVSSSTSTISNARVAVQNFIWSSTTAGGLIQLDGTNFVNNHISIMYRYFRLRSLSHVNNCKFEVNDDYPHQYKFRQFINLENTSLFTIRSCAFNNNMNLPDADQEIDYGIGVNVYNAGLRISKYYFNNPSSFTNLGYGVYSYFGLAPPPPPPGQSLPASPKFAYPFSIRDTEFNFCFVGVRNAGINGSTIVHNTFNMGALPPYSDPRPVQAGIVYEGSIAGFDCQENAFLNHYTGPFDHTTVGIFCDDTGTSNKEIRRNTYDRMTVGNLVNDVNGSTDQTRIRGLNYLCNSFTGVRNASGDFDIGNVEDVLPKFDIEVTSEGGVPDQSFIRSVQGLFDSDLGVSIAAGNTFSDPISNDPADITGIFNIDNDGDTDPNYFPINYQYFDSNPPEGIHELPGVIGNVTTPTADQDNLCGIEFFFAPCCDEQVKQATKDEYYEHKGAYQVVMNNVLGTGPTNTQAQFLSHHQSKMDRAAYQVIVYEINDTLNYHKDSLYTWIKNLNSSGAELWLSKLYLSEGNGNKALQTLQAIPSNFVLDSTQLADIQKTEAVTQLLMNDNLDSLSQTTLELLATYDQSGGQTEAWVKNILTAYGAHYSPEYVFAEIAEARERTEEEYYNEALPGQALIVSPNPAKDFVTFNIRNLKGSGTLEIIDLNGRLLKHYDSLATGDRIRWDAQHFASGIYFYRLINEEGMVESGKLILNR